VNVDTMSIPARNGDVFLLCSDGLTTMVSDEEIRDILVGAKSLRSGSTAWWRRQSRRWPRQHHGGCLPGRRGGCRGGRRGATLISRTAEQAGLTGERVRAATDRLRGTGAPMPAPSRRRRAIRIAAIAAVVAVVVGGAFLIARSVYFLGTNDDGNVALYRGCRTSCLRDQPLLGAVLGPGPGRDPLGGATAGGDRA
jgi:protein phosphatase